MMARTKEKPSSQSVSAERAVESDTESSSSSDDSDSSSDESEDEGGIPKSKLAGRVQGKRKRKGESLSKMFG
jgi:hypothetical protein